MSERLISVSHLTALDASPEDFVTFAAAAGFNAVGLRISPPQHTPQQWPVAGDLPRARELRRRCDDLGLAVLEIETFSMWPNTDAEALRPGFAAGAALGARYALSAGIDDDEPRMIDNYRRVCDVAADYGLKIALEFMPFRPMRSLPDATRVLRAVDKPNACLLIDTLHLSRSGATPADLMALRAEEVGYIHLCDAPALIPSNSDFAEEARTRRLYPGEGELPLAEILAWAPQSTPVSVEAPNARYAYRSPAERLRVAGETTLDFMRACEVRGRAASSI